MTSNGNGTKVFDEGSARNSVQAQADRIQGFPGTPDLGIDYTGWGPQFNLVIPSGLEDVPGWSIFPARRDQYLRRFWKTEPLIAGAIYAIESRIKSLPYEVSSIYSSRKKYFENLLENAQFGEGFSSLVGRTLVDLLTQDNGAFWELIGAGRPEGRLVGPVKGVAHLDSSRCWRTFDPTYPVIYVDPVDGSYHRLHYTRVIRMSQMTQPHELARGIGFCAVSRVLGAVQTMKAIQTYKREKVTGSHSGIGYGNGFRNNQFREAIQAAEYESQAEGFTMWKKIPFILNPDSNAEITLQVLSLASLPDGWDEEKDTTLYVYSLALGFGVDVREFWPATSSGATKADASLQHLKARGKGLAELIRTIEHAVKKVFPADGSVTMEFDYTDDEEDIAVAQLHRHEVDTYAELVNMKAITPEEARKMSISKGILDTRIVPEEYPEELRQERERQEELDERLGQGNPEEEDEETLPTDEDNNTGRPRRPQNDRFSETRLTG